MNYTQAIYNWSDTDLLQFKINGECLEANFDSCAAFGIPLAPLLRSPAPNPPVPIGCRCVQNAGGTFCVIRTSATVCFRMFPAFV